MSWKALQAMILAVAVLAAGPARAAEPDPAVRQIQTFYAALLTNMKHGPALGPRGRYQAMAPAVDAAFDLPTMIQFIVGPGWTSLAPGDRKLLVEAFRRMTIASYAANFDEFHGEHFDVETAVQSRGSDRFVTSSLVPPGAKAVPLIYRMRESDGAWRIIDVLLNGYVSELAMRRSDFAAALTGGKASALADKMNALSDALLAGTKPKGG